MNEVEIVVVGRDRTGSALSSAQRAATAFTERVSTAFRARVAPAARQVAERVGDIGRRALLASAMAAGAGDRIESDLNDVGRAADDADGRLRRLGDSLGRLRDRAGGVGRAFGDGWSKQRGRTDGFLGTVNRLVDRAKDLFGGMTGSIKDAVINGFKAHPGLIAAIGAIGIVVAPIIASAVTAGILMGLSGGVVAAGIALVAKDPKVTAAGKSLKDRFLDIDTTEMEANVQAASDRLAAARKGLSEARTADSKKHWQAEVREAKSALDQVQKEYNKAAEFNKKNFSLKDAAQPFVEPLVRALERFQASADTLVPSFARMSEAAAPIVDKLVPALIKLVENALPGMERALAKSGPMWDKLAEHLPKIGEAVGRFFDIVSGGSPEAAEGLGMVLSIVENWIVAMALLIRGFTELLGVSKMVIRTVVATFLGAVGAIVNGAAKAFGWVPGLGPKLKAAAANFNKFKNNVNASLAGIKDKTVKIRVNVTGNGARFITGNNPDNPRKPTSGGFSEFHTGGVHSGAWPGVMDERGPEAVRLPSGSTIVPAGRTRALMAGGGAGTGTLHLIISAAPNVDRGVVGALLGALRFEVATAGRGSVRKLLQADPAVA